MLKYQQNLPVIHWDRIVKYHDFPKELTDYLDKMVRRADFTKTKETAWAYGCVASFLEDGWQSAQKYVTLRKSCLVTLKTFGQLINKQISGTRYEPEDADKIGSLCATDGPWPTKADKAAFLYFVATES